MTNWKRKPIISLNEILLIPDFSSTRYGWVNPETNIVLERLEVFDACRK